MNAAFETWQSVGTAARHAGSALLNLIYPPLCLVCRAPVSEPRALCGACWTGLTFFDGAMCRICGLPFELDPGADSLCGSCQAHPPSFDCARAAMAYDDASKGAILALKRADRLEFAQLFALWLKRVGQPLMDECDVIVPVPLHWLRLWARRYNQSALLAQRVAQMSGKPFDPFLLSRTRATPSQGNMPSAKARQRNVRGAFKVPAKRAAEVSGRAVLLVDDVLTTGATIHACTKALKRAGAAKGVGIDHCPRCPALAARYIGAVVPATESMPNITIYTTPICPYCVRAKALLRKKGVSFEEIDVFMNVEARRDMEKRASGRYTVPQIFIGERHVGGCDDLYALERAGELDPLISAAA